MAGPPPLEPGSFLHFFSDLRVSPTWAPFGVTLGTMFVFCVVLFGVPFSDLDFALIFGGLGKDKKLCFLYKGCQKSMFRLSGKGS